MQKEQVLLKFINIFLANKKINLIYKITELFISKNYLFDINNSSLFTDDLVKEIDVEFPFFYDLHVKIQNTKNYMITMMITFIPKLNDKFHKYKLSIDKEVACVSCEIIKQKNSNICACLRDNNIRKKAREQDETINCICGLLQYRDQDEVTHTSFGDGKLRGSFYFKEPHVLYDFILNSEHKQKYLFVEKRTDITQAYFDLDFKCEILQKDKDKDKDKFNELKSHIIDNICKVLDNFNYVYCDKTIGDGLHLYFPKVMVTKKRLINITKQITDLLTEINIFNFADKIYETIIDKSACNNGLVLLFQEKNGSYYKINREKSTYYPIPDDLIQQLTLCSLRTNIL